MNKLKLTTLSERILKEKESKALLGGNNCGCSCYWENNTGSSVESNRNANYELDITSPIGCGQYIRCDIGDGRYITAIRDTHV